MRPTLNWVFALAIACATAHAQDTIDTIEEEGLARTDEGRAAQAVIDEVNSETRALIDDYHARLKLVAGLRQYNGMLKKQLTDQAEEIAVLQKSIGEVQVIERQILPLLSRMLDGLDNFIELDMPFLMDERRQRAQRLRDLLVRSDVTVAEKTRRVLEAYQIENDYGRTLEAYKGKLNLADKSYDVDYLRIGRVALVYRTVGNDRFGYWDSGQQQWVDIDSGALKRNIDKGLRIARQETAPELFIVPVQPPVEVM